MAITIDHEPYGFLSLSGNPFQFEFSSDQTAQANFSYFIEVYAGGVLVTTRDAYPENGASGKIDISDIAENYTSPPTLGSSLRGSDALNYQSFYITVYERYGTTPALQLSATSTAVWAIKGKLESLDWANFSAVDYVYPQSADTSFLNLKPGGSTTNRVEYDLSEGETEYLFMMFDQAGYSYFTNYEFYDADGVLLDSDADFRVDTSRCVCYAVSYSGLAALYGGAGTFAENVAYVDFNLGDIAFPQNRSKIIRFNIKTECSQDTTRVQFLGQLGAIESFTMNRRTRKSISVENTTFNPAKGSWDGDAYVYSNDLVGKANYQMVGTKSIVLTSDWITEEMLEFLLNNLFQSPFVKIEYGSNFVRIENGNNGAEFFKKPFTPQFNITWTISLSRHTSMRV